MKLEIEKHLIVSTAHITKEDMDELCSQGQHRYPFLVKDHGYGVLVQVEQKERFQLPPRENSVDFISGYKPEPWTYDFSEDFIEILRIAQENDCLWVNFDRDGSEIEGLPVHDW